MDLGGVGHHRADGVGQRLAQLDRGRERGPQQGEHFRNEEGELDRLPRLFGLAAEEENLLHELFGPHASGEDPLEMLAGAASRRHLLQRQLAIPQDGRQDIIEIVGDPTGQRADGFHLLRLTQLGFEQVALGDVAGNALHFEWVPGLGGKAGADFQSHPFAALGHHGQFVGGRGGSGPVAGQHLTRQGAMLWRHQVVEVHLENFVTAVASGLFTHAVDRGKVACQVVRVDEVVGMREQVAIALFALTESLLRPLTFRDVFDGALIVEQHPTGIVDGTRVDGSPERAPVLAIELRFKP